MACAQSNLLPLVESRALEGERGSTYWCMPAILCSLFLFFLILSFFSFRFLSQCFLLCCYSPRGSYYYVCDPPIAHGKVPFYNAYRGQLLLFQPLTTFVWSGCPCQPPLVCQSPSQHHLPVLAVPLPIARQRLFCLFVCRGILTYYGVGAHSSYPSWHAPSGSNSSLLLLGNMSSQQDISPKRA